MILSAHARTLTDDYGRSAKLPENVEIRWLIHAFYPGLLKGSVEDEKKQFERLFFGNRS